MAETVNSTMIPTSNITKNNSVVSEAERLRYLQQLQDQTTITMIPAMTFLITVALAGLIGNSIVLSVYSRKFKKNPTRILIMTIAVFDLVANVIAIPGDIYDMFHIWNFDNPPLCRARLFMTSFVTLSAGISLLAVAVVRYRKLCKPHDWQISVTHAKVISLVIACIGALSSIPYSVTNGRQTKVTPRSDILAYECSEDDEYKDTIWPTINNGFFLFLFLMAAVPLLILYIRIGVVAWKANNFYKAVASRPSLTSSLHFSSSEDQKMMTNLSSSQSADRQLRRPSQQSTVTMNKYNNINEHWQEITNLEKCCETGDVETCQNNEQDIQSPHWQFDNNTYNVTEAEVTMESVKTEDAHIAKIKDDTFEKTGTDTFVDTEGDACIQTEGSTFYQTEGDIFVRTDGGIFVPTEGDTCVQTNCDTFAQTAGEACVQVEGNKFVHTKDYIFVPAKGDSDQIDSNVNDHVDNCKHFSRLRDQSSLLSINDCKQSYSDGNNFEEQGDAKNRSKVEHTSMTMGIQDSSDNNMASIKLAQLDICALVDCPRLTEQQSQKGITNVSQEHLKQCEHFLGNLCDVSKYPPESLKVVSFSDLLTDTSSDYKEYNEKTVINSTAPAMMTNENFEIVQKSILSAESNFVKPINCEDSQSVKPINYEEHSEVESDKFPVLTAAKNESNDSCKQIVNISEHINCNQTSQHTVKKFSNASQHSQLSQELEHILKNMKNSGTNKRRYSEGTQMTKRYINRTTAILILISAVYAIGFLPYIALSFFVFISPEKHDSLTMTELSLYNLFIRFYFINSAANPIIYSLCGGNFRRECIQLFRCR